MFECRLNQFLVEILQEYNAALGLNNPPPTAQLLNAMATFVKQNTVKSINLSFDENSDELTAKATYNDNRFAETKVNLSSLGGSLDVYDLAEKLEGSESIVVDIDETNSKIEFHIDAEILSKIERALLLPLSAPTEFELVGVNDDGEQVRVKLGEGVEYDDLTKTIKASGSASGFSLYRHRFTFEGEGSIDAYLDIISPFSDDITPENCEDFLLTKAISVILHQDEGSHSTQGVELLMRGGLDEVIISGKYLSSSGNILTFQIDSSDISYSYSKQKM